MHPSEGVVSLSGRDALAHSLGITLDALDGLTFRGRFEHWFRDASGLLLAHSITENLVVNVGLAYILTNGLSGNVYVGLLAATPTIVAGTLLSTVTFTDVPFSESVRPTWTKSLTAQTYSNSASKARFSFTGAGTNGLGGAFLASTSSKSDTAGTLIAAKAFSGGNLGAVANGYTLDIQYDISAA